MIPQDKNLQKQLFMFPNFPIRPYKYHSIEIPSLHLRWNIPFAKSDRLHHLIKDSEEGGSVLLIADLYSTASLRVLHLRPQHKEASLVWFLRSVTYFWIDMECYIRIPYKVFISYQKLLVYLSQFLSYI